MSTDAADVAEEKPWYKGWWCPRCGTNAQLHELGVLVLRISPRYGLMCIAVEAEEEMDRAEMFFSRQY